VITSFFKPTAGTATKKKKKGHSSLLSSLDGGVQRGGREPRQSFPKARASSWTRGMGCLPVALGAELRWSSSSKKTKCGRERVSVRHSVVVDRQYMCSEDRFQSFASAMTVSRPRSVRLPTTASTCGFAGRHPPPNHELKSHANMTLMPLHRPQAASIRN